MNETRKSRMTHTGRARVTLIRRSDGQLHPSNDTDIGDIWAEQRRIQLAEAIEEDKKKAARRRLRKERGLFGLAKTDVVQLAAKARMALFGDRPSPTPSTTSHPKNEAVVKMVELKITLPSLPKPNLKSLATGIKQGTPRVSKKAVMLIVIALAIAGISYPLVANSPTKDTHNGLAKDSAGQQSAPLVRGTPTYLTILPAGKSIQGLGGWARVSPPDHNPVYAFADRIGTTPIDVSEQPLPPNFQANTASQVAQLAQSYSANQKLVANGTAVYIGTSAQGPQSVIFTEDGLLILIKSTAPVLSNRWINYVNSLQ